MNYRQIDKWLSERNIILEDGFTETIQSLFKLHKKNYRRLSEFYTEIGCTKTDISRWKYNPCSTQALCSKAKKAVVFRASTLFDLSPEETEQLANRAGLSLCEHGNHLVQICREQNGKYHNLLKRTTISERMLQYYMEGKAPTKQALLAISISMELSASEMNALLRTYGYCLSKSLPNDAVVSWYIENKDTHKSTASLLNSINEVLEELELPLLMTKSINR